nr:GDP-mannose 4,6-dehydratase [Gemmatimonadota bacterium]
GQPLTVFGTGEQDRDFVYVGDVAEASRLASERLTGGWQAGATGAVGAEEPVDAPAFNVGTGRATTVLDLVRAFRKFAGRDVEIRHAPARAGELLHSTLDPGKIAGQLGWKASTPLAEGLERTFRYFESLPGAVS